MGREMAQRGMAEDKIHGEDIQHPVYWSGIANGRNDALMVRTD